MKKLFKTLKELPAVFWSIILVLLFSLILSVCGAVAKSALEKQNARDYEYYDVAQPQGYNYRTPTIEGKPSSELLEAALPIMQRDWAFIEGLPDGEQKLDYINIYIARYSKYFEYTKES